MENLEQLLNSLIEKGWKPRGKNAYNCCDNAKRIWYVWWEESYRDYIEITPRKLTSKESWLRQFVCGNGMIKHDQYTNTTRIHEYEDERDSETCRKKYDEWSYLFRLIESALRDESELESFILDNIKL